MIYRKKKGKTVKGTFGLTFRLYIVSVPPSLFRMLYSIALVRVYSRKCVRANQTAP